MRPASSSCSPANTNSTLTLGDTAKQLRQAHPDQIAYVRVVANDDYQGLADATIAYKDLSKKGHVHRRRPDHVR